MPAQTASHLVLLTCAALLFRVPPVHAQVPDDIRTSLTGRGYALLIGVAHYDGNAWPELSSITSDLEDLRRELAPHFNDVAVLQNPTTEQIRDGLRRRLRGSTADSRLLIYYAGHGFTAYNSSSRQQIGYITGRDTPRCEDANCRSALSNAIAFNEIDGLNRDAAARHILMLFDSCFSGAVFLSRSENLDAKRYSYANARSALQQPVRYYITAGAADQRIPANSPFAPLVLRGLRGEADIYGDGFVTAEALGAYLQRNVPVMARTELRPQKGTITDARLSAGQFLFLTGLSRLPIPIVSGQPLPQGRTEALSSFAERMCQDPLVETRSTRTELSAKGKAEFGGIWRWLGGSDAEVGAPRLEEKAAGVLRDYIGGGIKDVNKCRERIIIAFKETLQELRRVDSSRRLPSASWVIAEAGLAIGDSLEKVRSSGMQGQFRINEKNQTLFETPITLSIPNGWGHRTLQGSGSFVFAGLTIGTILLRLEEPTACAQSSVAPFFISNAIRDLGPALGDPQKSTQTVMDGGQQYIVETTAHTFSGNGEERTVVIHNAMNAHISISRKCVTFVVREQS